MNVKIFEENRSLDLEESVNIFLGDLKNVVVIDIKYQTMWVVNPQSSSYEDNCACYSAMIIYK